MQQLRKSPVFFTRSLAEAFRQVFIPCPKVSCDDETVKGCLRQDIRSVLRADAVGDQLVVERHGLLIVAVDALNVPALHAGKCAPPAALYGEAEVSVPCELQEDGEAACHMEAGTGVL